LSTCLTIYILLFGVKIYSYQYNLLASRPTLNGRLNENVGVRKNKRKCLRRQEEGRGVEVSSFERRIRVR
jgi:hypothetical protein